MTQQPTSKTPEASSKTQEASSKTQEASRFAVYFKDGREEYLEGISITDALINAGYVPTECKINFYTKCATLKSVAQQPTGNTREASKESIGTLGARCNARHQTVIDLMNEHKYTSAIRELEGIIKMVMEA